MCRAMARVCINPRQRPPEVGSPAERHGQTRRQGSPALIIARVASASLYTCPSDGGLPVVEPVEQPESAGSELLPRPVIRAGNVPVERHRHVEPNRAVHLVIAGRFPVRRVALVGGGDRDGSGSHRSGRRLARRDAHAPPGPSRDRPGSHARLLHGTRLRRGRARPEHPVRQPDHAPASRRPIRQNRPSNRDQGSGRPG